MQSFFLLGTLRVTEAAKLKLKRLPLDLIARHAVCEHGNITARERKSNLRSLAQVGTIVSRYAADPTDPSQGEVMVITHKSWDDTVVCIESEP